MPNPRSVFSLSAHVYALVWGVFVAASSLLIFIISLTAEAFGLYSTYTTFSPWLLMIIGGVIGLVGYKERNMKLHQIAAGIYLLDLVFLFMFSMGPTPFDGVMLYPTIALSLIGLFKRPIDQKNKANS
jgi:peptidoglycan/LPS O-acetylase OafA/YrhL